MAKRSSSAISSSAPQRNQDRVYRILSDRGSPATATSGTSSAPPSLTLTNSSNLILSDASGRVLWTTNVTGTVSGSAATAVLLNTGNLVIRSPNGTTAWQSFDHPGDTFLPGMKIRVTGTGLATASSSFLGKALTSPRRGASASAWTRARSCRPSSGTGRVPWRAPSRGRATRPSVATGQFQVNSSSSVVMVSLAVVRTGQEMYLAYSLPDGSAHAHTRFVLTYSGEYQLQSWGSSDWAVVGKWPANACDFYGQCGPYGYCDGTVSAPTTTPTCKCLDGFEPASLEEWSRGRFSQGCRRKEALPLRCGHGGFVALPGIKPPDKFVVVENRTSEECAMECTKNCSCMAYAYANLSSRGTMGGMRCMVWAGELIDTERVGDTAGSDTLYLRTADLDAGVM
ncbi:hypothetical protein BDA96_02G304900, partial [Sorghum bicolor]